jgi:hypothetical protein
MSNMTQYKMRPKLETAQHWYLLNVEKLNLEPERRMGQL